MVTFGHGERKGMNDIVIRHGTIFMHHDGALGDTLLSLPCINIIRHFASSLHIAGRRDVVSFLKEAGVADEISGADSGIYSSLYAEAPDEKIRAFLSGFDSAIVFTARKESQLILNVRSVIPDTEAILTIPPEASGQHAAEFRLSQCCSGVDETKKHATIRIRDEETIWAAGFLRGQGFAAGQRLIAVHPGSGGKNKCWPIENYAALLERITKDPRMFSIVITGPAEDAAAVSRQIHCTHRVIMVRDESLMRVAALLSLSDFYLGNDSGISHLAGMLGCRGVALFGPTDPAIWRPQGQGLEVVRFMEEGTEAAAQIIARLNDTVYGRAGDEDQQ